jgi:crotonobetainyl-CoA:carnitine CoA-transferase CaiB-like acyl-CoA transferase
MQILEGMKVLDITQFIAGSRCTQLLADMGAEVVKVEPPHGDTLRMIFKMTPGVERNYSVFNRNKYGIAVNMNDPQGREVILKLAAISDIFVHNLIPGSIEKLGLGYEDIRPLKKDIIYIAISGFGASGLAPERAAFDIIAQATGGQFWNNQDTFLMPDNFWGDLVTGAYATISILFALIYKMKTGQGQSIDISMQDVMYYNNYRAMMDKALGPIIDRVEKGLGRKPKDVLNSSDRMPFYGFFKAKDGKVAIVSITTRQWKDLVETIGRPEMASDPKFSNLLTQIHNHEEAVGIIEKWTVAHTSQEIISILESKKIPCGIAYTAAQINEDENLRQRGMFGRVYHEKYGEIDIPGLPFKFSATSGTIRMPAPSLGEHNRLILEQWLGYTSDEVLEFYKNGTIL